MDVPQVTTTLITMTKSSRPSPRSPAEPKQLTHRVRAEVVHGRSTGGPAMMIVTNDDTASVDRELSNTEPGATGLSRGRS
jgi:chorismate synthase